jgi:6-phosphofructokinase 1
MRVGILTGGGDCPGLNAVIRAVVRKGTMFYGDSVIGFLEGWRGVLENRTQLLDIDSIPGILHRGGTILRTSRTNPDKYENGMQRVKNTFKANKLDALIAIGGDDTLGVAQKLYAAGLKIVGVPKTIDNDLSGTDFCFGFDTAVSIATDAIDRLHTTAEAHNRVMVVEVMGRDAGWIATYSGLAGGADAILIPERPFDIDQICDLLKRRHARGKYFSIVVVAEGAKIAGETHRIGTKVDEFGHPRLMGIGNELSEEIEKRTGYETRAVILGHVQRGGSPTAFDRVLATRYGIQAIDMVHQGEFGKMASLQGQKMASVPLSAAIGTNRKIDPELYEVASVFFG